MRYNTRMTSTQPAPTQNSSLPLLAMIFGLLSLTGVFVFLSIPAIIIAIVALKKTSENKGYSITGLVSGIISTVFSLILIAIFTIIVFVAAVSENQSTSPSHAPSDTCASWDKYCSSDSSDGEESDDPTKQPQST